MALLDAALRLEAAKEIAATLNAEGPVTITKQDIAAAVDGIDAWIEANAAAMNAAIPQPARAAMTTDQKAALFAYTALRRNPKRAAAAAAAAAQAQGGRP